MATFVVIDYESELKAEEVRLALLKMQKQYLIDLADAVVVVRDDKGKVRSVRCITSPPPARLAAASGAR